VALVARDLGDATSAVRRRLGAGEPYADPGIIEFGLANAVFALGDTFLEVVSPVREATTAGRLLDKRGDGGYMAIFQLPDRDALAAARSRAAALGIRVVWQADLADISGTHLHPKDVPGAIVSLDAADPPATWHWAGPAWTGGVPDDVPAGGIVDVTVRTPDPTAAARRWSDVLGVTADGPAIELAGGQSVRFEGGADDGIVAATVALPAAVRAGRDLADVCGVQFALIDAKEQA
jgi:hypothetical protein